MTNLGRGENMDINNTELNIKQIQKDKIEKIFISYPRLKAITEKVGECQQVSKIAAEPKCLLVMGPPGAGKSTIYKKAQARFPRRVENGVTIVPVLAATIPVPATVKALATRLLTALGDPLADKGTTTSKTERLYKLIEECKVELIALDEFQHFIDSDSQVVLRTVSDWLKNLINETKKPVVLFGLPSSIQILYSSQLNQLSRRFPYRIELNPFKWESEADKLEFRCFLKALDDELPLPNKSHLADPITAFRLYYASRGIVNYVMKIVRTASHLAVDRNKPQLTEELLAESFDLEIKQIYPRLLNPFRNNVSNLSDIDKASNLPSMSLSADGLKKKRRQPSIGQLLSAR